MNMAIRNRLPTTNPSTVGITPLLVVTNLQQIALLTNSTAERRRRIADTLSASLYSGDGVGNDDNESSGGGGSNVARAIRANGDQIFVRSLDIVTAVLQAARSEAGAKSLEVGTSWGCIAAFSSTLQLTAGRDSTPPPTDDGSAAFDRRSIVESVEAVAMATNRSSSVTSVVTQNIAVRRQSIQTSTIGDGSVEFRSYGEKEGISSGRQPGAPRTGDAQGLSPPSRIRISASLFKTGTVSNVSANVVLRFALSIPSFCPAFRVLVVLLHVVYHSMSHSRQTPPPSSCLPRQNHHPLRPSHRAGHNTRRRRPEQRRSLRIPVRSSHVRLPHPNP